MKEFTWVTTLETMLHKWEPNGIKGFKILTFGPIRK